jgi:hypothetical protein
MFDDYSCSIETLITIVLAAYVEKAHRLMKCDGERRMMDDDNAKRRLRCPIAPKVLDPAGPHVAQLVMASILLSAWRLGDA